MGWTTGTRSVQSTRYCVFIGIGLYPLILVLQRLWYMDLLQDWHDRARCFQDFREGKDSVVSSWAEIGLKQPEDEIQGALRHILPGLSKWRHVISRPMAPLTVSQPKHVGETWSGKLRSRSTIWRYLPTWPREAFRRESTTIRVLGVARFLGRTACEGRCERKAMPHWAGRRWSPANIRVSQEFKKPKLLLYTPGACQRSLRHLRPVPKYQFLDRTPANYLSKKTYCQQYYYDLLCKLDDSFDPTINIVCFEG